MQGVIIGIGVNLNLEEKSLEKISQPATSLNVLLEKEIDRDEFLDFLLKEFFVQYDELLQKGFLLIKEEYSVLNMVMGKLIKVVVFNKKYNGIAKGIDDKGQLILDCKGKKEIINIGDIIC
ncbi:MAG: hypothetical protein U5N58_13890 [Actinomycetota bacterium]|nr:hypothetical protein [Actinomycetota bacterium]